MSDFWKDYEPEPSKTAPVQEPVAWHDKIIGMEVSMDVSTGEDDIDHRVYGQVYEVMLAYDGGPDVILAIESERNYTTPPAAQRQWVGLTQQDIDIAFDDTQEGGGFDDFARAIEAKLREKNGWYRQHVTDGSPCWCEPEISYTDPETGASVIVHKEPQ
jgi:hypothetical protein